MPSRVAANMNSGDFYHPSLVLPHQIRWAFDPNGVPLQAPAEYEHVRINPTYTPGFQITRMDLYLDGRLEEDKKPSMYSKAAAQIMLEHERYRSVAATRPHTN